MEEIDEEVLQLFIEESREHLNGIEDDLLAMEAMETLDAELVNRVFRALHTIKGGAGFFDFNKLRDLAHAMENVLDLIRNDELTVTSAIISSLFSGADTLAKMVDLPQTSEDRDIGDLLVTFNDIVSRVEQDEPDPDPTDASNPDLILDDAVDAAPDTQNRNSQSTLSPTSSGLAVQELELSADALKVDGAVSDKDGGPSCGGENAESEAKRTVVDQSIRVQLSLLDRLMALAGELVLTRNALLEGVGQGDVKALIPTSKKVDAITSHLQKAIMSTRMQTIDIVFNRFRRVVRDLSQQLGKKIRLEISGQDVELDKNIIEALGDPLTHLIRNAVDHGFETPSDRTLAGKPAEGVLSIAARHEAGQVVIEISDDGAGIDPNKIAEKAVDKGIYSAEEIGRMSEKDITRLIFDPGFSTASEVTDISGRGVGMDVVRQNLATVGGVADVESVKGAGTVVSIKLPLTLAIIPSVLVGISEETFAIPQVNVVEMVSVSPEEVQRRIQRVGNLTVLRLRGQLLPLIELIDHLKIQGKYSEPNTGQWREERRRLLYDRRCFAEEGDQEVFDPRSGQERREHPQSVINIVVVSTGSSKYGIRVDELHESAEIVVKPLGVHFKNSSEFAGATILGDGRVALILNAEGISGFIETTESDRAMLEGEQESETSHSIDTVKLLIIENAPTEIYAIPLNLVARIEKFHFKHLQVVGGGHAISYRGGILPLFSLEGTISSVKPQWLASECFYAIVFAVGDREVGLMVAGIRDVVDFGENIDHKTHRRKGVGGSLVLDHTIVELLDIYGVLEIHNPEFIRHLNGDFASDECLRILLVDDSPYYREQMAAELRSGGYDVVVAEDGLQALEVLNANKDICLVITDIEMPRMDGLEMVRRVRSDAAYTNLPIIAVTVLSAQEAEKRGYSAGVNDYQVKLDRQGLLAACRKWARPLPAEWNPPEITVHE
ncbi:MAG TPA: hybrid sensor histidine kinase/response regulator [Porticoccaceae bacterium]|nr:hybrid sensor histidine kinase/response regulator [Porticoccaceae bacterium]HCO61435.1 hybrid sensor histidine kinase/response regulator [Porticoccaceae bacterium]